MDKLKIKMNEGDHPDVLFEMAMMVRKKYRRRRTKPDWDELISSVVTGATLKYQDPFTTKMLEMELEEDGQLVLTALQRLGNELYTASSLNRTGTESNHETSLTAFNRTGGGKGQEDDWSQNMQCYWCWKKGHKASDCGRRKAGHPKSAKPGSSTTPAGGGGGSSTANQVCARCKGPHMTKNCYHDDANASKRPAGWMVKKDVGGAAVGQPSGAYTKPDKLIVHRSDYNIVAIDRIAPVASIRSVDYNLVSVA